MYCVYDNTGNVIAFHDEYDVVETYLDNLKSSHDNLPDLHIGKIKKKKIKNVKDLDNLYLVRYADTYVQSEYLTCIELMSHQSIYDNKQCKDVLLKILECYPISNKERKSIERTVDIIDRLVKEAKEYTPTLNDLKSFEADYAHYLYNINN